MQKKLWFYSQCRETKAPLAYLNLISIYLAYLTQLHLLSNYFLLISNYFLLILILTRREQEIPHLYRWRDELRLTRRFLTSVFRGIII